MAPSTPLQPSQIAALLTPGLRAIYHSELENAGALLKRAQIFDVKESTRSYEQHQTVGALDAGGMDFRAAGSVAYDSLSLGYKTTFKHRPFAKGFALDREAVEDNLYGAEAGIPGNISEQPRKLANAIERYRELVAADVFNGAFTDSGTRKGGFSYAGADAVGLCSTAHPLAPDNTSSTQSNEGTNALSAANVDAARQSIRAFTDDRGQLVATNPSVLLVPPELEYTALKIKNSANEPGHANNDANVVGGMISEVIVWDYLTDANAWFLVDGDLKRECLHWYDRTAPEFRSEIDGDRHIYKYQGYFRASCGWSDWRFVYGNNPS